MGPSVGRKAAWALAAVAVCALCASPVAAQPSQAALEQSGIIPDVIDAVSPACSADVIVAFGSTPVEDGQLLAPPEAAAPPNVTVASAGGLFTLLTLDPDAPDPANPTRRSILHYLVTNIPADGTASQGTEVTPWASPRPPSGTHRYVFLAYQQPGGQALQVADPVAAANNSRANFDVHPFASQYGLGEPCGVAWFTSRP